MSKGITTITARDVIRGVRRRWFEQYATYGEEYRLFDGSTIGAKRKAIGDLDLERCSREDVNAAIGTDGWADNTCDFCDQHRELIVRLGDEPDYDARWVDICPDCLREAVVSAELVAP